MRSNHLCLLFGVVPTTCSNIMINRMLKLVCKMLPKDFATAIRWPMSEEEKVEWAAMVQARVPTVDNAIGFADGKIKSICKL